MVSAGAGDRGGCGLTIEQAMVIGAMLVALGFFLWGRIRYDIVAASTLLVLTVAGIVDSEDAFSGFGHPAVATVALVLILTRGLETSGAVDRIARLLGRLATGPTRRLAAFTGLTAGFSGFMNNIGACALFMPVALQTAEKTGTPPSKLLMPISFASLLGGLVTLIGTPPNVIVAGFRGDAAGEPFGMFDFTPVGIVVALVGLVYVVLIGWRFLPVREQPKEAAAELFQIDDYIAEATVRPGGALDAGAVNDLEALSHGEVSLVALLRKGEKILAPTGVESLYAGDVLVLEGPRQSIQRVAEEADLDIMGPSGFTMDSLSSGDVALMEAVVAPNSPMLNRTPRRLRLHQRYGVNLLAVARRGQSISDRIGSTRFEVGDVLLLQGDRNEAADTMAALGLLPLAYKTEPMERHGHLGGALGSFGLAILATALGLVSVQVAFLGAVLGMLLFGSITVRDLYESIDWPIIILLGAMIPVGQALETTGATALLAAPLIALAATASIAVVIAALMVVTMLLSDLMNNAATAVVAAPVAIAVAEGLGLSIDPFLMAIAIGASSTYLTPIGHQSNLLVMGPGGYRFSDYWRMGLALDVLIVATATPMILLVWPVN